MVWPFTVHSISNKNLRYLINKDGTQIETKNNISLLRPNLDSDETKCTCDENPVNHMKLGKSIFQVGHVLIKETIENYAITNLPNEIIEMILVDAVKYSTKTYVILSQTC